MLSCRWKRQTVQVIKLKYTSFPLSRVTLSSKVDKVQDAIGGQNVDTDPSAHETEPSDLGVGISIQNLTKIYDAVREYTFRKKCRRGLAKRR